ncbi:unnamed protein product [Boreogadus saida]
MMKVNVSTCCSHFVSPPVWSTVGVWRLKPALKKYACELTLDPNTAHRGLSLSEDNRRVGVYLDRPAGSLSFYSVSPGVGGSSDTLTHLHTFQSTFTKEDLLPGFKLPGLLSVRLEGAAWVWGVLTVLTLLRTSC